MSAPENPTATPLHCAVDIGSNALRMIMGSIDAKGRLVTRLRRRAITRLGAGMEQGVLQADNMESSLRIIGEYIDLARAEDVPHERMAFVATSAVRNARNRQEFLDMAQQRYGIDIQVIDGVSEAALTVRGALLAMRPRKDRFRLVVDIGGGSVEFILVDPMGQLVHSASYEIGVVRLTEKFIHCAPLEIDEYLALQDFILERLQGIQAEFQAALPAQTDIVGTAGTYATAAFILSKAEKYDPEKINGYRIELPDARGLLERVGGMSLRERVELLGIEKGREDLIVAGLCLAININRQFEKSEFYVSDYGVREGLLAQMASATPVP